MLTRLHVSKHRRWTDDGKWIPGKVRILERSGIRKLMRAAWGKKMPDERAVIIKLAAEKAEQRAAEYMNAHARRA